MQTLKQQLSDRLSAALESCGLDASQNGLSPASDAKFGDYQSNAAMVFAKKERANPRELAGKLVASLQVDGLSESPEIAGAGFLNFRITGPALGSFLDGMLRDDRLAVAKEEPHKTIVLDFSSPNVAKPMHVGHIRSTILGDCLTRVARFLGHTVITDNHIGDWGTQFGKVIYGWKHLRNDDALTQDPIAELVRLYRDVNAMEAGDAAIAKEAREELVKLQARDPENLAIWQTCVELSWKEFQKLYDLLDIRFDEHLGESAYNDALAPLCEKLVELGLAEVSDGALCVFFRDIPDMEERPAIVRKADGGFLYATTDLATIEYRINRWQPDEIWYVVGAPQSLHFQQIFEIAKRMGLTVTMRHIPFGSILGEDRKIMKTRSGENVGLSEVLKEALTRADVIIREKNSEMSEQEIAGIARDVGIGAVKYAELCQHRMTDYVFSWDKMMAFHGNTAPYLQNAFVRVRAIFRKAGEESSLAAIHPNHPAERTLGMKLARYPEILPILLEDFRPNLLANYLFELAESFHGFYEACPVLKSEGSERASRLALCKLTSRVLAHGLGLMGINCPQRM